MKIIKYKKEIPAVIEKDSSGVEHVIRASYLQEEGLFFTDDNKDIQIAEALKVAYDGEYEIVDDGIEPTVEEQITSLKEQLSSTDYKIIKCSEAQLVGEELPYDIAALHAERQSIRDKINELEGGAN